MGTHYVFKELQKFLDNHVPGLGLSREQLDAIGDFSGVQYAAAVESVAYAPFVSVFHDLELCIPDHRLQCEVFNNLYGHPNLEYTMLATGHMLESGTTDRNPDLCCYSTEDAGHKVYNLGKTEFPANMLQSQLELRQYPGRAAWAWIRTLVVIKTRGRGPFRVHRRQMGPRNSEHEEYLVSRSDGAVCGGGPAPPALQMCLHRLYVAGPGLAYALGPCRCHRLDPRQLRPEPCTPAEFLVPPCLLGQIHAGLRYLGIASVRAGGRAVQAARLQSSYGLLQEGVRFSCAL